MTEWLGMVPVAGSFPEGAWARGPRAPRSREPRARLCWSCRKWEPCPCGCGIGWCRDAGDWTEQDALDECDGYDGEAPDREEIFGDDPRIDMLREEGDW